MPGERCPPTMAVMEEVVRATLELKPRSDPIEGTIKDQQGGTSAFSSWLGLVDQLERLRVTGHVSFLSPGGGKGVTARQAPSTIT